MRLDFVQLITALVLAGVFSLAAATGSMGVRATGDAIVAGRDVSTGDIRFGLTAREINGMVETQIRFRSAHEKQIKTIAEDLDLDLCTVADELRKLALEGIPDAVPPEPAADLSSTEQIGMAVKGGPGADMPSSPGTEKRIEQARTTLVSIGRGIIAGRDVYAGDIVFGIPKAEFTALIAELRQQDVAYVEKLQALSADLQVNRCATTSFLETMGRKEVPIEQLHAQLQKIAQEHRELISQWASVTESDQEVADLRARARTAIDNGDYDDADELLRKAGEKMRAKADQTLALAADYARVEADRGRLALVRMQYESAAQAFGWAHDYAKMAGEKREANRYLELQATAHQDAGDYVNAETAFLNAAKAFGDPVPGELLQKAKLHNNLGTLYFARSKYSDATGEFEKARSYVRKATDVEPEQIALQTAISLNGLGDAATARSLFDEAEDFYSQALREMENALGPNDHRLMNVLTNLGRLKTDRGKYDEAEELFRRALDLNRDRHPEADPELAATKSNFAALYYAKADIENAERLWLEALEFYRSALAEDHIVTLSVLANLGHVYHKQEKLDKAGEAYRHALDVWTRNSDSDNKTMEGDHLVVASILRSLANLHVAQGEIDEAEEKYERALDIIDKHFSRRERKNHPLVASLYNELAVLQERRGDYKGAADAFEEAREVFELKFGTKHQHYGTVTSNLARIYGRLGRLDEAETLYLEAIEIAEATAYPLKAAYRLKSLARVYHGLDRLDDERQCLEKARTIYIEELGEGHRKTQAVITSLAELESKPAP